MIKKKKSDKSQIARSEFALRTLSYYQKQGGFYNELITILLKLRDNPVTARCIPPNRVMNEVSWLKSEMDLVDPPDDCHDVFSKNWKQIQADYNSKDCALIKCVFFILLQSQEGSLPHFTTNYLTISHRLEPEVTSEKLFFPKFKHLLHTGHPVTGIASEAGVIDMYLDTQMKLAEARMRIEQQEALIKELTEMGMVKDAEIAQLRKDLAMAQDTIASIPKQSALDSSITFGRILGYIRNCRQYKFTTQIFMLLNWMMRNTATDEEYKMLDETQQYMQEQKSVDQTIVINNDNKNCNVINEANDPVFGEPFSHLSSTHLSSTPSPLSS